MSDITVNVTNAGAANVAVSGGSTVNASVGNGGTVKVDTGTISPGNATVVSGTLAINSVTTLAAGSQAYVKNDLGTAYAAKLDIGIPAGPATSVTVGKTTTLSAGSSATVTGTTDGGSLSLSFGIPAGAAGSNGSNGTTPAFTASATTLSAGSSATVTATPSNGGANVALAFGIPRGADGAAGSGGGASLSDATPAALGTASAGTSTTASRSDHVHAVQVISYANLTNVPSTFAPSSHTHTLANLTQSSATTGQVPTWTGTAWAAATPASGDVDGGDYVGVVASISITQHPMDVSISVNQGSTGSASFTVAASASTGVPVDYQWQRNQGSEWVAISAATSATLSRTGLAGADDGTLYRCVVSAFGLPSETSNTASLAVAVIVPAAPVITITAQPQTATIASTTSTASFSITASVSSGTLAYQWQKREAGGTTWANVSGATSSTLSLTGLAYAADHADSYRCRLTATGAASVTSSTANLNITWATVPQITIIDGPSSRTWSTGGSFMVSYDERIYGGVTTTRQWQARPQYSTGEWGTVESVLGSNSVFGGTTSRSLTITSLSPGVQVRCVIASTNSYGTTTATTGTITIFRVIA